MFQDQNLVEYYNFPQDIQILGWCPAGPVFSSWGEGASSALVGDPCQDKNALWGTCFASTSFAPHLFLWGWLKLNLALLLDQLRLAQGDECWW